MSLVVMFVIPGYLALLAAGIGNWWAGPLGRRLVGFDLTWIERLCLGALTASILLGLLGLATGFVPHELRSTVARTGLALLLVLGGACFARDGWSALRQAQSAERVFALGYLALCVLATSLALFPARLPSTLVDGPYVAKHDLLGVRVQYTTGNLPTDNAIPHVVSEYILRDIPFRTERPLMPGQEVTNRPILAGVILAAFRAATYLPPKQEGPLPKFNYVGSQWPDFSVLMRDEPGYRVSQALGTAMNALLLLGVGAVLCRQRGVASGLAVGIVALYLSSPYFLFQTYFTWPKALAGFFIIVAWLATAHWRAPTVAGAALGMAYLSHPYAIAYFAAYLAWHCGTAWAHAGEQPTGQRWRATVVPICGVAAAFAVVTAPWFLWVRALNIPADLVAQNLLIPGQTVQDFLWVRITNLATTVLPLHLIGNPFDVRQIVTASAVNASGAVGMLAVVALLWQVKGQVVPVRAWVLWAMPSLSLIAVFSNAAVPVMHGLQPLLAALLGVAGVCLWQAAGPRPAASLMAGQVLVNVALLAMYFNRLL